MSRESRRIVSFGGSSVAIECDAAPDSLPARIVDLLFSGMPERDHARPRVTFHIGLDAESRCLTLRRDELLLYQSESVARLAILLINRVTEQLVTECTQGLLIHAAALARGRAVILPGRTGAGKTTLAAWLTKAGFDYLSDELVYIPDGELTVQPFPRPLAVKTAGLPVVRRLLDFERHADQMVAAPEATFIPPRLLGVGNPSSDVRAAAVVSFQYQENARFAMEPLSPAATGLVLMGCLVNARNLPGHGFRAVARLAREVPGWKMIYGNAADVSDPLAALLESGG
jgi:hypothetical protein